MKNIHVLPTPKPSLLFVDNDDKKLRLYKAPNSKYAVNIYITSDKKPKQGEWSLYQNKIIHKCIENILGDEFKKIILTTDQDLIKDGEQYYNETFESE